MTAPIKNNCLAQSNANGGISLVQTVESGRSDMSDLLQRIREHAVQLVEGTYTARELQSVHQDVSQMTAERERFSTFHSRRCDVECEG